MTRGSYTFPALNLELVNLWAVYISFVVLTHIYIRCVKQTLHNYLMPIAIKVCQNEIHPYRINLSTIRSMFPNASSIVLSSMAGKNSTVALICKAERKHIEKTKYMYHMNHVL